MSSDEEFEAFLSVQLAPPPTSDRAFVAHVSARVSAESLFRRRRAALLRNLGRDIAGLVALAAALLVGFRFAPTASPTVVLVSSLFLLGLWLVVSLPRPVWTKAGLVPGR